MVIETERLYLRQMNDDDFDSLKSIICDSETMKYYPCPYDEKGVLRWIDWNKKNYQNFGFGLWAICLKQTNQMIGDCGITIQNINHCYCPEIGYHINKNYWQKHYGKEAGIAVRDWAFKNTTLNTLYSYMNSENVPSYSLAKALGMKKVDEYDDEDEHLFVYAINKQEWLEINKDR